MDAEDDDDDAWSWHSVSISSMSADTSDVIRRNRRAVNTSHNTASSMSMSMKYLYSANIRWSNLRRWRRAPSRSRKPLRLAYDSLRLASRLKPASRSLYGGGVSYGGLRRLMANWRIIYSVSQKITPPLNFFLTFFPNGSEFLVQILHAYCTFLSTLDCRFLFNYLQL